MNSEEYRRMFQIEDTYWWYQGMQRITFALLGNRADTGKRLRVLDAGCGTGGMLLPLSKLGSVVGLDFSDLALQYSSERGYAPLLRGSVTALPFAEGSFDLVTSFDVIYHQAVDDETALREFGRVLKPGGHLIVRVPAYDFLRGKHDRMVHTRHRYSLAELTSKLQRAGFSPVRATYANTILFPLEAAKRIWETLFASRASGESDLKLYPKIVNNLLLTVLTLESWFIGRFSLPFGLSAFCLATKQE